MKAGAWFHKISEGMALVPSPTSIFDGFIGSFPSFCPLFGVRSLLSEV